MTDSERELRESIQGLREELGQTRSELKKNQNNQSLIFIIASVALALHWCNRNPEQGTKVLDSRVTEARKELIELCEISAKKGVNQQECLSLPLDKIKPKEGRCPEGTYIGNTIPSYDAPASRDSFGAGCFLSPEAAKKSTCKDYPRPGLCN